MGRSCKFLYYFCFNFYFQLSNYYVDEENADPTECSSASVENYTCTGQYSSQNSPSRRKRDVEQLVVSRQKRAFSQTLPVNAPTTLPANSKLSVAIIFKV